MDWRSLKSRLMATGPAQQPTPQHFMGTLTRLFFFVVFTAAGLISLGSAAILPEYAALVDLRAGHDNLAHQIDCEQRLCEYNRRLSDALQSDPVLMSRLMMRYGNSQPVGVRALEVESRGGNLAVPQLLNLESLTPPPRQDNVYSSTGRWINQSPGTKTSLTVLGLGLIVVGTFMFGVRRQSKPQ